MAAFEHPLEKRVVVRAARREADRVAARRAGHGLEQVLVSVRSVGGRRSASWSAPCFRPPVRRSAPRLRPAPRRPAAATTATPSALGMKVGPGAIAVAPFGLRPGLVDVALRQRRQLGEREVEPVAAHDDRDRSRPRSASRPARRRSVERLPVAQARPARSARAASCSVALRALRRRQVAAQADVLRDGDEREDDRGGGGQSGAPQPSRITRRRRRGAARRFPARRRSARAPSAVPSSAPSVAESTGSSATCASASARGAQVEVLAPRVLVVGDERRDQRGFFARQHAERVERDGLHHRVARVASFIATPARRAFRACGADRCECASSPCRAACRCAARALGA